MNSQTAYQRAAWELAEYGKTMQCVGFLDGINVAENFLFWFNQNPTMTPKEIRQWLTIQIRQAHRENEVSTRPDKQAALE